MFLRFFFAALTGGLLLSLQIPSPASACSCIERPVENQIEAADIIIEGEFLEAISQEGGDRILRWRVTRAWKADVGETFETRSAASSASCGYQPVVGDHYLVLASRDGSGAYRTGLCSGNELADSEPASELLAVLGVGVTPIEVESSPRQDNNDEPSAEEPLRLDAVTRAGCQSCSLVSSSPEIPKSLVLGIALLGLTLRSRRG